MPAKTNVAKNSILLRSFLFSAIKIGGQEDFSGPEREIFTPKINSIFSEIRERDLLFLGRTVKNMLSRETAAVCGSPSRKALSDLPTSEPYDILLG